jgi:hypothetical protein
MSKSGQQIAKENILKFRSWIAERDASDDWKDYVRGCKLNRTEIAAEAGIGLAAFRQNPLVKETLRSLEARLAADGLISSPKVGSDTINESESASDRAVNKRILTNMARSEARVKDLEEQNAALKAEVTYLRDLVRRLEYREDHLGRTGRLLPI